MLETVLVIATLFCGIVAGLLFAFAVVAMPGIKSLPDREFIRAFQAMDRVIQRNQPLFMLVWVGSVLALMTALVLGLSQIEDGLALALLVAAAAIYLLGVQLPTALVNIPLNNRLQVVEVDGAGEDMLAAERAVFETRWNRWNGIRAVLAVTATALLLVLLLQL